MTASSRCQSQPFQGLVTCVPESAMWPSGSPSRTPSRTVWYARANDTSM